MPTYFYKTCLYCNTEFRALPRDKHKKFCTSTCSRNFSIKNAKKEQNTTCINCNTLLVNTHNKFCSRSCAATYNNNKRPIEIRIQQGISLKKYNYSKLNFCRVCNKYYFGNLFEHHMLKNYFHKRKQTFKCIEIPDNIKNLRRKGGSSKHVAKKIKYCANCNEPIQNIHKTYCNNCFPNIKYYRLLAAFKFNVFDYPADFDLSLISTYGWFSPNGYKSRNKSPNLAGVSRDHLYTIADGFKNKIDPKILAHPANCRIMLHNGPNGNNSKKNSSITLDELIERIKIWDSTH